MAKETLWINDIGSLSFIYLQNNLRCLYFINAHIY